MTKQEFENIFLDAMMLARQQSWFPYDTGNLKFVAFQSGGWLGENKYRLYIDEQVAPYVYYTNERWMKRKARNPHENWIENKLIPFLSFYIARRLNADRVRKR